jgi:hypothetical protein
MMVGRLSKQLADQKCIFQNHDERYHCRYTDAVEGIQNIAMDCVEIEFECMGLLC